MKRLLISARLVVAGLVLATASWQPSADAIPMGIGGFSGGETIINFDDLTGGACSGCGDVVTNQYAGSGVTFVNATATANTFLATLIPAATLPNVVFVFQGGGGMFPRLSMVFSVPVNSVGLDFGSSLNSFLTMAAYDSTNALVESHDFVGLPIPFGLGGFAGIHEGTNIARLDVSYHPNSNPATTFNYSFDNLRFEPTARPIPEPATLALFAVGLAGFGFSRRKQ